MKEPKCKFLSCDWIENRNKHFRFPTVFAKQMSVFSLFSQRFLKNVAFRISWIRDCVSFCGKPTLFMTVHHRGMTSKYQQSRITRRASMIFSKICSTIGVTLPLDTSGDVHPRKVTDCDLRRYCWSSGEFFSLSSANSFTLV